MYGPTGIGVLYGRYELLEKMPPWQTGGEMIRSVSFEESSFNAPPFRFEAGTPPIAEAIGLAAAIAFRQSLPAGWQAHESALMAYLEQQLSTLPFVQIIGQPAHRLGALSLRLQEIHPRDAGELLDQMGIAVRVGHHCAMPLMQALGVDGTLRVSLAIYNSRREIDALIHALRQLPEFF